MYVLLRSITERLKQHLGALITHMPGTLTLNFYEAGEGLRMHTDNPELIGELVISISLRSACELTLEHTRSQRREVVTLEPRTVVVQASEVRYEWRHGIQPGKVDGPRVSVQLSDFDPRFFQTAAAPTRQAHTAEVDDDHDDDGDAGSRDGDVEAEEGDDDELAALNIMRAAIPPPPAVASDVDAATEVASSCKVVEKRTECHLAVLAVLQREHSRLELCEMEIEALPQSMVRLNYRLTHLDLSSNLLAALPAVVCQLTSLEVLELFGNRLATLPEQICSLSRLRRLLLVSNRLRSLPTTMGQLESLEMLDLEENPTLSERDVPACLASLPRLQIRR
jgi:hypothetical protein